MHGVYSGFHSWEGTEKKVSLFLVDEKNNNLLSRYNISTYLQ